ncbi:acyl-CoA thioesterase [Oleiphilus sp. HI0009]|uniref:acyl-CoA thioesterase n=1 Tax=unclassified Oleiphilus TaxID=2631174 RepID=UPI0007C2CD81|nr:MULTISPECIES: acyl-CoA thioesterase [unclassified Oleiphilus]KZX76656.1 acyl-CoA thioesterase [Oleiphilus sp. HI0009]MCH2158925.1 acyl-CoA thioesterase [Oleiphilaceae bacterium]KZY65326.1 acyl-CoA thioesterase [Oleiphilus sp. HI0066]KZY67885.1 acyl-CoA thioesterase [Oleiphilus sp. HI0067]KZY68453.1 acyl-CoA thioesterase [Oleiphilus sp. HI0067]
MNDSIFEKRKELSLTRITKAVFPDTTNHHDTLFGGTAMQWMDEASFISATRFSRKRLVTVSSDRIDFEHPVPAGSVVELIASVADVGRTSLTVRVEMWVESMYHDGRTKAISGVFKFVAVDQNMQPTPVMEFTD